jgi:hypothetical protein
MATPDPGPLTPIGPDDLLPLVIPAGFVDLTNNAIADTYPHYAALDRAHGTIAAASDATGFDQAAGGAITDADGAHQAHSYAFENADPADVTAVTGAQSGTIDGHAGDYDETPPADLTVTDPGPIPTDPGPQPPPEI